jgi:hypothetical protein
LQDPLGFSFIVGGKAWAGSRAARAHSDAGSVHDGAQPYLSTQRGQRKWRRGSLGEDGESSAWAPSEHAPHNLKNLSHDLASRHVSCGPFDGITIKSEVAPRRRVHPRVASASIHGGICVHLRRAGAGAACGPQPPVAPCTKPRNCQMVYGDAEAGLSDAAEHNPAWGSGDSPPDAPAPHIELSSSFVFEGLGRFRPPRPRAPAAPRLAEPV